MQATLVMVYIVDNSTNLKNSGNGFVVGYGSREWLVCHTIPPLVNEGRIGL